MSAPAGILCSNYRAEVPVLLNSTETINLWEEKPKKAVFLTDSLSALQALMSGEQDTTLKKKKKKKKKKSSDNISYFAQSICVVLQWISAHTGVRGNKIADQLVKEGKEKEQPPHICPAEKSKLLSTIKRKPSITARLEDITQTRKHSISCHDTNTIFCLRTGPCRLNSHLKRIGAKTSAQYPCTGGPNTRTLPAVLFTLPPSKSADMAHLSVPQNQALGVYRRFASDIQVCGTHGREDLVNATIISNVEEENVTSLVTSYSPGPPHFQSRHTFRSSNIP